MAFFTALHHPAVTGALALASATAEYMPTGGKNIEHHEPSIVQYHVSPSALMRHKSPVPFLNYNGSCYINAPLQAFLTQWCKRHSEPLVSSRHNDGDLYDAFSKLYQDVCEFDWRFNGAYIKRLPDDDECRPLLDREMKDACYMVRNDVLQMKLFQKYPEAFGWKDFSFASWITSGDDAFGDRGGSPALVASLLLRHIHRRCAEKSPHSFVCKVVAESGVTDWTGSVAGINFVRRSGGDDALGYKIFKPSSDSLKNWGAEASGGVYFTQFPQFLACRVFSSGDVLRTSMASVRDRRVSLKRYSPAGEALTPSGDAGVRYRLQAVLYERAAEGEDDEPHALTFALYYDEELKGDVWHKCDDHEITQVRPRDVSGYAKHPKVSVSMLFFEQVKDGEPSAVQLRKKSLSRQPSMSLLSLEPPRGKLPHERMISP